MSKVYSIKTVQRIPISLEKAWDFFSSPGNLQKITPANLGFNIISKYHGEVSMDSSWEVKLAQSLEDNNIKWIKPKPFNFYLISYAVIVIKPFVAHGCIFSFF